MKSRIMKYGINGEGIAYVKRKPVFVPLCLKSLTAFMIGLILLYLIHINYDIFLIEKPTGILPQE